MTCSLRPGLPRHRRMVATSAAVVAIGLASEVAMNAAMGWQMASDGAVLDPVVAGTESTEQADPTPRALPGPEAMDALAPLVGEWQMAGTTHRTTDDEPTGSAFTATQTARWEVPGRVLRVDWTVMDGEGATLGDGRSRITYDEFASAIVNTYAGRDLDTTFSGSATLIDAGGGALEWRGHETRGMAASVNFEVTYLFPDASTCVVDFIPTCVDGELGPRPSRFTWERRNPFLSQVPFAERLVGVWPSEDDSAITSRIRFGPGRRSLLVESSSSIAADATPATMVEILWFDPSSERIHYRGHQADGAWMRGTAVIEPNEDALAIRWRGVDRFGESISGNVRILVSEARLIREADVETDESDVTETVASFDDGDGGP